MRDTIDQLRITARALTRSPVVTVTTIGTVAVLICGVTLIVSLLDGAVLSGGPYRDADRLAVVRVEAPDLSVVRRTFPYEDYLALRMSIGAADEVIEDVAASASGTLFDFLLTRAGDPVWLRGAQVTGHAFAMLGVAPILGRGLTAEDERPGAGAVIVLHEMAWRTHFGGDPGTIGRVITINDRPHTIVGVMPRAFRWNALDAWTPLRPDLYFAGLPPPRVAITVRRRSDVTDEQVRARLAGLVAGLAVQRTDFYPQNLNVQLDRQDTPDVRGGRTDVPATLFTLLGAVAILTVAGCINVAALLLARATARIGDLAVRLSLGASRWALLRRQLIEVATMTVAATALGVWLARTLLPVVVAAVPEGTLPNDADITLNWRVLATMVGVTAAVTLVCAWLPARLAARTDIEVLLRRGGKGAADAGGSRRIWQAFVVGEVTVAMVLLVLTAMVGQRLWTLRAIPFGWEPDRVLSLGVSLVPARYPNSEPARQVQFMRNVLDRYRQLPGVEAASLGGPPLGSGIPLPFVLSGRAARPEDQAGVIAVGADYFTTYRIPIRQGRQISDGDEAAARTVALVNEAFVRTFLDEPAPLGRTIQLSTSGSASAPVYEVIGVVANTASPDAPIAPHVYVPFTVSPLPPRGIFFLDVRTAAGDPKRMLRPLQQELWAIDPNQPFGYIRTAAEYRDTNFSWPRFQTLMLGTFGTVALLLAAGGIHGILTFQITRATRELGLRLALGAAPGEVVRDGFTRGLRPALVGVVLGGILAAAAARLVASKLSGMDAATPETYVLAAGGVLAISALACYLPARRAANADPTSVLRAN